MQMRRLGYLLTLLLAMGLGSTASFAQDGKLKVKVTPKQAYVFVDGQVIRNGSQSISLPAGKHTVVVVNYGYKMESRDVNIDAGKSTPLDVTLTALRQQCCRSVWARDDRERPVDFRGGPRGGSFRRHETRLFRGVCRRIQP